MFPDSPFQNENWPWKPMIPLEAAENPAGYTWPRATVITPSFNQVLYLEETVRSVLLQGYPNLEYIVIDGGSTDGSVKILQKYSSWISYWVSEKDRGQAHAINKGLAQAHGELVGWINSDDILLPGALYSVAEAYLRTPQTLLAGDVINFTEKGAKRTVKQENIDFKNMVLSFMSPISWHQPGIYVPVSLVKAVGGLDESLRYFFDHDWMVRLLRLAGVTYLGRPVAKFRIHANSKTIGEKLNWLPEQEGITLRYWDEIEGVDKNQVLAHFELLKSANSLSVTSWDWNEGIAHLKNALKFYPRIILSLQFWKGIVRSLLPQRIMGQIRILFPRD